MYKNINQKFYCIKDRYLMHVAYLICIETYVPSLYSIEYISKKKLNTCNMRVRAYGCIFSVRKKIVIRRIL